MARGQSDASVHPSWNDYPELFAELDLSKNSDLTFKHKPVKAIELNCATDKKLDWICSTCEHEWKASGGNRTRGSGCPFCSGRSVHIDGRNSMATTNPELAIEYQGDATKIIAGTKKRLDWKCSTCEHEWKAIGDSRFRGRGCPSCANLEIHIDGRNSMAKTHPDLAKEYQGDATKIVAGTGKRLDWKCLICEHEWKQGGNVRIQGHGCPFCSGHALHIDGRNSMAATNPELAIEYQGDATKIIAGTHKKLDWKCPTCEHEWKASGVNRRGNGSGCPSCANQVVHIDGRNSMAKTHPDLAKEYQGDATKIIVGTNKKLDWKCSTCEHEWKATGNSRLQGSGCPACSGRVVHIDGRNSMAITNPELAIEYQGDATKVIAGTNNKLDWSCSNCGYKWKTTGSNRIQGKGCPVCANKIIHPDGRNSMAQTHPELTREYQGDATKVIAGTGKILDWKCSICGIKWKTSGAHRVLGNGCPACAKYGYDPSLVGYVYIHHYNDEFKDWLKCGITNYPSNRIRLLKWSAKKFNIEVTELDIYKFDDGFNARRCENELLSMKSLRFDSNYDIDGKDEFFKFEALDEIKKIINNWL